MSEIFLKLEGEIEGITASEPLSRHCTMRVGGPAAAFIIVRERKSLIHAITKARELRIPFHILGAGSNTLFSDAGYDGLIIKNQANQITINDLVQTVDEANWQTGQLAVAEEKGVGEVRHEAADPTKYISFADLDFVERPGDTVLTAESGVNLTACIIKSLDAGLTGLQWYGGIPGVIGGAVYNNIHGGTHLIGERLKSVSVLTPDSQLCTYRQDELELGYDMSRFHHSGEIILSADFLLTKATPLELEKAETAFRDWVKRKSQMQPQQGSMGSTFQNISQQTREQIKAPTTAAGWLIDQVGLKGHKIGGAQIAPEHANFIVNTGTATAKDIYQLMILAKQTVKQRFGIDIIPEVVMVGWSDQEKELLMNRK